MAEITSYEAPHYAVFSNLLPFNLSSIQIFSSASCSHVPSVCVLPLMLETKFHTHTESYRQNYYLYIVIVTFLDSRREDKRFRSECQKALPEFNLLLE
jgi:hypothetical protein